MEALVKKIQEEADISEEKAKIAAEAAIDFIKKRVAHRVDAQVDQAFKNMAWAVKAEVHEAVTGEPAETFLGRMEGFAEEAKEKFEDLAEDTKERFGEFVKNARGFFGSFNKKQDPAQDTDKDKKA